MRKSDNMNDPLITRSIDLQEKSQKLQGRSQSLRSHSEILNSACRKFIGVKYHYAVKPLPKSTIHRALALMNNYRSKAFEIYKV